MIASLREKCRFITENNAKNFIKKRNVLGMGFGYKTINDFKTFEPCLKIFVTKKESIANLGNEDLIPKIYEGIKTDVVQTGEFKHHLLSKKKLPLKFGYSIGPNGVNFVGTAGCLVIDKDGDYHILSNNHVLSNTDKLPIGTPILHPAVKDGGKYPDDLIATLSKKVALKEFFGQEDLDANLVDCAIAKIDNTCLVTKKIAFIGKITGVCDAKLNMKVKKVGRTTELTTGIITAVDASFLIQNNNNRTQFFKNQIITTAMDADGDSGSLLLDECNNAIGLLFGGSDSETLFNPIKEVLKALNVRIVTC